MGDGIGTAISIAPARVSPYGFPFSRLDIAIAEDSGQSRDDLWQISRTASDVLRPHGRRRESDHLFGMRNPGAGPRWLAKD